MTRIKKKVISNVTLENAQEASASFATAAVKLDKIQAKMNDEINKVKSKYQDDITDLQESLSEPQYVLQVFADEQKESWGKRKSMELLHCTIGYRTGMPKVTKDKKFTWDGVTEIISKLFPDLVRSKVELDKDAIIALSKEDGFKEIKEQCYIDVVQDESFYVEAKKEELQPA
ncbi:MAG: host-nuclease inhibitor Gam family protein [Sediminibacterium sp.]|nr:host-nuclease inhibitor Gam family protein [Sediminibacterium sp.]MDP3128130.1 host-nuclease inhibitor Gam family protein [Sediminibacterium sp.]